jgi:hypothetical protein
MIRLGHVELQRGRARESAEGMRRDAGELAPTIGFNPKS